LNEEIVQLARDRDRVLDECWKLLDDTQRNIIRVYLVSGQLAAEVPMKLRRAQERLMEAVASQADKPEG
jgi:hypothetical protein